VSNKRFCLCEIPALSDYCFWAPYKYSATTTTTTLHYYIISVLSYYILIHTNSLSYFGLSS